jgi:DNA polymerase IIIc chi subunit
VSSGTGTGRGPGSGGPRPSTLGAVAELHLHRIDGTKRAGWVVQTVQELNAAGHRVVVWVADEGRRSILDDYLWTFEQGSFIPHAIWGPALGEVPDPVVLLGEEANPNGGTDLVVADDAPPPAWAAGFDRVHDVLTADADGQERERFWQSWQRDFESEA